MAGLALVLLAGCDPCAELPCAAPSCLAEEGPVEVEGQVTVSLGALRRMANDSLLRPDQPVKRRLKAVPGLGSVSVVAWPAPLSLVPVRDAPQRLRLIGTLPLALSRAPERAAQHQLQELGRVMARYEQTTEIALVPDRSGWRLETRAAPGEEAELVLGPLPEGLEPSLVEAAQELLLGMARSQGVAAANGLVLARLTPWPDVAGAAQVGAVEAAMDGALLRIRLRPRARLGPGLDLGHRGLDPGAGHDATVALSPAWLSALAAAESEEDRRRARVDDVDYLLSPSLSGEPPQVHVHARRLAGCGWAEVKQPVKIGRTGERWGIAPRGEASVSGRGGADRGGSEAIARAAGEAATGLLDRRLQHPLLTAPDGRRLRPQLVRYEGGAVLLDGIVSPPERDLRAPVGLPRGARPPGSAPALPGANPAPGAPPRPSEGPASRP